MQVRIYGLTNLYIQQAIFYIRQMCVQCHPVPTDHNDIFHPDQKIFNGNFYSRKFLNLKRQICYYSTIMIDCLTNYSFTSILFHLHGDVPIADEGLQSFGLCSALRAFEQGRIFIVPHLLRHGTLIRRTAPTHSPLTTRTGMQRTYLTRIRKVHTR
jgi:hypothetical protein